MTQQLKYIFFDCMETIVDLHILPKPSDYALWAFSGSGVEHYWNDFHEFLEKYEYATENIRSSIEAYQEYEMIERIQLVVEQTESIRSNIKHQTTRKLYDNYWKTYKSKCYVKDEIRTVLSQLARQYKLAVVSNFKVKGGIQELLEANGLNDLFEFVVTSVYVGRKKPDPGIYEYSIQSAACSPDQIIFVGDDYENDYLAPRRMGMKSLWLDKEGTARAGTDRVIDFYELRSMLLE